MAINFVTGLPRHGKTLWTIVYVKQLAEREHRQVYTCNIPGINIPGWLELDHPDKWMDTPDGSIIIIDELQDFWQKSAAGAVVPLPILELSKHGKRGIDFYFITQEPNLVHATPRDLCQHHYYVVRAFGSHNATVRKFERMQLHPEKVKKMGDMTPWRYPKEAFSWYKSADVHNIKRVIPFKLKMIPVVLALVGLGFWAAFKFAAGTLDKAKHPGAAVSALSGAQPSPGIAPGAAGQNKPVVPLTPAEYLASYVPRVEGLAQTAPRYDELTKPVTFPKLAACVQMGARCDCYTQQATKLQVPKALCVQVVKYGFFDETAQVASNAIGAAPSPAAASVPLTGGAISDYRPTTSVVALAVPSSGESVAHFIHPKRPL